MERRTTAIVTGGSRGIGRSIAKTLANQGMNIAIDYLHSEERAREVAEEIRGQGAEAVSIAADIAKPLEVQRLVKETIENFGSIDVLVNNAGLIIRPGDWKNTGETEWDRTIDVNLKGTFYCIKTVAPYMLEQKKGKIVNISSAFGLIGSGGAIAYTAAKAGVINLTKTFAKVLAPYVNVNAVCPGTIETEMTLAAGDEFIRKVIEGTPLKRIGSPEDVANAVAFLASDKANFITGHALLVDGGYILK